MCCHYYFASLYFEGQILQYLILCLRPFRTQKELFHLVMIKNVHIKLGLKKYSLDL